MCHELSIFVIDKVIFPDLPLRPSSQQKEEYIGKGLHIQAVKTALALEESIIRSVMRDEAVGACPGPCLQAVDVFLFLG